MFDVFSLKVEPRQVTHSLSTFMELKWEAQCSTLNETINANSLIELNLKWSTFFLQIARRATELKESSISWLLWVLLVSLFQASGRRQAQVVFGDELLLQRLEGMKYGGQCVLGYTVWVPGLSLDFMGTVTQCYLDARLSLNYLLFPLNYLSLTFPYPHRGPEWVNFFQ